MVRDGATESCHRRNHDPVLVTSITGACALAEPGRSLLKLKLRFRRYRWIRPRPRGKDQAYFPAREICVVRSANCCVSSCWRGRLLPLRHYRFSPAKGTATASLCSPHGLNAMPSPCRGRHELRRDGCQAPWDEQVYDSESCREGTGAAAGGWFARKGPGLRWLHW